MKNFQKTDILLVILIMAILPYFYLCFFSNPSSDDFVFAVQSQNNDLLHIIKQTYLHWNGRYISNIFIYLNPITWDSFIGYKIFSGLMIVLFVCMNYLFIGQIYFFYSIKKRVIIALVFSLIFIHNMPIISEGIYWFTGSVIYLLGIIITVFYFTLLIKMIRNKSKGMIVATLILLFFACGFNEVLSLLIVFFLTIITGIFYGCNFPLKRLILVQLFFALIFFSLMLFSPGNIVRGETYDNSGNLAYSLLFSLLQVGRFNVIWILSIPIMAMSLLYRQFHNKIIGQSDLFRNSFYLNRWVSLVILFAITVICVFPAYWSTGILGQHRTLNVAYFFFILMWFVNLTVWFNHFNNDRYTMNQRRNKLIWVIVVLGIIFTGNGYFALSDIISGNAKNYDTQLKERYRILENAQKPNQEIIILPVLKSRPACLFTSDMTNNPNDWVNESYKIYFQLSEKTIMIDTGLNN